MTLIPNGHTNRGLGYPDDARLLIINADDFGMCHAVNVATLQALTEGLVTSCTLMAPCPWHLHALALLQAAPTVPFGVHLTAISEQPLYRWGPVSSRNEVPSLVDEAGYFYAEERIDAFVAQVNCAELEAEFRAQIERVLASGLRPTHLDSHCGVHERRDDIAAMTIELARTYGLALRAGSQPVIERVKQQGYPCNDHALMDSYDVALDDKAARYTALLRALPSGLSEWAVHPGLDTPELRAAMPSWQVRQTDYDFVLSQAARELVEAEGIILLDYRALQPLWSRAIGGQGR